MNNTSMPVQELRAFPQLALVQSQEIATDRRQVARNNRETFAGSCHCGAIRFEVALDPAMPTRKCNCSFCMRTRFWKALARCDDFRLLDGAEQLADYQFGECHVHHSFCRRCGVHPFSRSETGHENSDLYAISIACLESANARKLYDAPVRHEDGRNDDWWTVPAEIRQP